MTVYYRPLYKGGGYTAIEMPDHFKRSCERAFGRFPVTLTPKHFNAMEAILGLNEGGVEWVYLQGLIIQKGSIVITDVPTMSTEVMKKHRGLLKRLAKN